MFFYAKSCPFISQNCSFFPRSAPIFLGIALFLSRKALFLFVVRVFFQECFFSKLIIHSRPAQTRLDDDELMMIIGNKGMSVVLQEKAKKVQ